MSAVVQSCCVATLLQAAEGLLHQRELPAAVHAFVRAEKAGADPDRCAAGRWQAHMLLGHFESAWHESDVIRSRGANDPHRFWNGDPIDGRRVIVRCLHGLGDAVQMLRYLPLLRARCRAVTVEVAPPLLPLAGYFEGGCDFISWGEQGPAVMPKWDQQVEVMELPYLFRTVLADLPGQTRYLHTPSLPGLLPFAGSKPRVGIVWAASDWDSTRCLPVTCLARLTALPGIEFWNLQGGRQHAEMQHSPALAGVTDAAEYGDGLVPLAAVLAHMDLVITVDTLTAHMAGAISRPAWVLLQARGDWRWMHNREDSPWYPSVRLLRQPVQDDWQSLTDTLCQKLMTWLTSRTA